MFRKKKNYTIQPTEANEEVLIQLSKPTEITRKTKITVPARYKAIAYIDQKPMFRIEQCTEKEFVNAYGNEYIGKELRVAFISVRTLAQSAWGFGNIQVNNERLKEAYRLGANGKFTVEIVDYAKLIRVFPNATAIEIEQVREKIISTLKTVGTPILGEYFSNTSTSVFEMSSLIGDFRDKFTSALQEEKIFTDMGIKVATLTVDGFHANEDDLEAIRNRINA